MFDSCRDTMNNIKNLPLRLLVTLSIQMPTSLVMPLQSADVFISKPASLYNPL